MNITQISKEINKNVKHFDIARFTSTLDNRITNVLLDNLCILFPSKNVLNDINKFLHLLREDYVPSFFNMWILYSRYLTKSAMESIIIYLIWFGSIDILRFLIESNEYNLLFIVADLLSFSKSSYSLFVNNINKRSSDKEIKSGAEIVRYINHWYKVKNQILYQKKNNTD